MYCREGQQTEEEMYNNEEGGPAFNEFLDLIGQRVRLKEKGQPSPQGGQTGDLYTSTAAGRLACEKQ